MALMYEGRMLSPKLQQLFVGSIFRCKKVCHRESVLLFRPCFYIRFSVFHFFVPGVFSFFFFPTACRFIGAGWSDSPLTKCRIRRSFLQNASISTEFYLLNP